MKTTNRLAIVISLLLMGFGTAAYAGTNDFAVLDLSGQLSLNGPSNVFGNVGIVSGSTSKYNFASPATIQPATGQAGSLELGSGVTGSNSGVTIAGGTLTNVSALSSGGLDYTNWLTGSTYWDTQTPTLTVPTGEVVVTNPSQDVVINGTSGLNIVDLSTLSLNNGTLTLTGPSSSQWIINVTGSQGFTVNGSGQVLVSGGVNPYNVLFNVTGGDTNVTGSTSSVINGIILDTYKVATSQTNISFHDKTDYGALVGSGITITSGAQIIAPEPSTLLAPLFTVLGIGGLIVRRSRKRKASVLQSGTTH